MASISTPLQQSLETHRAVRKLDWGLLISFLLLLLFGLMSLYSLGGGVQGQFFRKQSAYIVIGIAPFLLMALVHPNVWRRGAGWLYALNIGFLVAVFAVGKHAKGAERWIPLPGGIQFQPSELAKLLTILTLAAFLANRQETIKKPSTFLLAMAHVAVPVLLIKAQPHLGAALVILVMSLAMCLLAGIPGKSLLIFGGCVACVAGLALSVPQLRSKLLDSYQQERISGLESQRKDIQGRNWQTDRAEIALGVGGVTGSGFMHGEQKEAGFIPEQHNDFIVTVIGEEGGLIGCSLLLLTYGFFFYRIFLIMLRASEPFYRLAAGGIFAVLGFHTFVNIAMVVQLVPVVGLWLPFLSYGGTAIWLCMACVGLLLNFKQRERPLLF